VLSLLRADGSLPSGGGILPPLLWNMPSGRDNKEGPLREVDRRSWVAVTDHELLEMMPLSPGSFGAEQHFGFQL